MIILLSVLQVVIVIMLSIIILLQKNKVDGLSGLSGGGHNFIAGRASRNVFSKITIIFAVIFMVNSLALSKLFIIKRQEASKIINSIGDEHLLKDKKIETDLAPQPPIAK